MSEDCFKTPVSSGKSFVWKLTFIYNRRIGAKFIVNCLIQDQISSTHGIVKNVFNVYERLLCTKNIGEIARVKKKL